MSMARKPTAVAEVHEDGFPVDSMVAAITIFLLLYGLVMVGSASLEIGAKTYGDAFHLVYRHATYLLISAVAAVAAISVPIALWQKYDAALLFVSFGLLILVLIPGVGKEVNGATRWIAFGPFSLQGSEFVKLFVMIYMAGYLVRRKDEIETSLSGFVKPLLVLTAIVLLLLGQPDFGAAIVIISAAIGMIFLAGVPFRFFMPIVALCISAVALIATLQPYRLARLTAFADPWEHQFDSGYQLTQALIAFGRGEWIGLGLGNSIQKLFFLPEAHTDFLFSIIAEELGVIGAGLVILLFAWLVVRGLAIGNEARSKEMNFHAYLAYGIALVIGIQASINLGVNLGILPTKGLTLPFMSYGGNSLIISSMMIAILLRIGFETRLTQVDKRGKRGHG
ncbi:MAG: putative lipid II flippase FtsW [Gammaproteobacteria bacterium]|jgi:cell division protein FtsW|nr:putative lipid II flippase FtsW [Gammaproteobacteria bacterium]MBT4494438.1 putative lipid II flippase FtsW [Gammaproteobacteria bacterium]MBT7370352.1 putative lipid II flippase FtsW [Gammaproteobacteria bacterium]